jgi:hypothetical protein
MIPDCNIGEDLLADIMGNSGVEFSTDDNGAFIVATDADIAWWAKWAETEEKIWYAKIDADDETAAEDDELIGAYLNDFENLQRRECELFGIEYWG